jgi:hypothetical protein
MFSSANVGDHAAAAIDLASKLDPTGGFGEFHGSWFLNRP